MSVVAGMKKDLKKLGDPLPSEAMAAAALVLAAELDGENSATSKSMCARSLLELLNRLWQLAPPVADMDGLDEIGAKRAKRLARRSA